MFVVLSILLISLSATFTCEKRTAGRSVVVVSYMNLHIAIFRFGLTCSFGDTWGWVTITAVFFVVSPAAVVLYEVHTICPKSTDIFCKGFHCAYCTREAIVGLSFF